MMIRRYRISPRRGTNVWTFNRTPGEITAELRLEPVKLDWYLDYEGSETIDKMFDQLVVDLAYQLEDWKAANVPGYTFSDETAQVNAARHPSRRSR